MRRASMPALNVGATSFFLVDQSTNGSFVAIANEPEVVLRREELMLRGTGRIGFGHSVDVPGAEFVTFTVRG